MTGNSFGHLFRYTTFGESHGPAIGCVVDGVPPCIPLAEADIQVWPDKRKPEAAKAWESCLDVIRKSGSSMMAVTLVDHMLRHRALAGGA